MNGWIGTTTAELIAAGQLEIGDGYRAKNDELGADGLPFARAQNVNGGFRFDGADRYPEAELSRVGAKVSAPGDCVITTKGSVGRIAYVTHGVEPFVYSPQLSYWRSLDQSALSPRFLRYWLQGPEFLVQCAAVKGSTDMADYVNLRDQRQLQITLPPPRTQHRIADVLGVTDDLIETNQRRIVLLEQMAQAIYREWFVHQRSADWEATTLEKQALSLVDGDWIETKDQGGDDFRLLQVSNIGVGSFRETGNLRYITRETFERLRCTEIRVGDILISRMPDPVGRAWLVDRLETPAITAVDVAILTPRSREIGSFLIQWLNSPDALANADAIATGTTRKRITRSVLSRLTLAMPPASKIARFHATVEPLATMTSVLRREITLLAGARDLLIPKLVTGAIDVSKLDLDALLKESVA